jgi:hypothetical protein
MKLITLIFIPLLISLPWWLFNYINFNDVMPTSGKLYLFQNLNPQLIIHKISIIVNMLTDSFFVFFYTFNSILTNKTVVLLAFVLIKIIFLSIIIIIFKNNIKFNEILKINYLPFIIFILCLCGFYLLRSNPSVFLQRYLAPCFIIGVIITSILLSNIIENYLSNKIFNMAIISFFILLILYQLSSLYLIQNRKNNYFYNEQTKWILDNVDKNILVGAGQSGTLGFYHRNLIHLEGKVNNEVIELRLDRKLYEYIVKHNIQYLIDTPPFINFFFDYDKNKNMHFKLIANTKKFLIYKRIS